MNTGQYFATLGCKTIIICGPEGSGKTSLAQRILDEEGFGAVAAGDLLDRFTPGPLVMTAEALKDLATAETLECRHRYKPNCTIAPPAYIVATCSHFAAFDVFEDRWFKVINL